MVIYYDKPAMIVSQIIVCTADITQKFMQVLRIQYIYLLHLHF